MVKSPYLPAPQSFNAELAKCWQALQGGRSIAVYRCLVELTGSLKTAVILSQLIYWTRVGTHTAENGGWVYKTAAEWEMETGLTKREQGTCKNKLYALNLIETNRNRMGGSLAYKVNLNELARAVAHQNGLENTDTIGLNINELKSQSSPLLRRYFSQRIAYHRDLVALTGCIHTAIMLSYMMREAVNYCSQSQNRQRAFTSHTIPEWQRLIYLSYKSQRTARNKLKDAGFIIEQHFIASRRIFTLIDGKQILKALQQLVTAVEPMAKRAKWDCTKGHNNDETSTYIYHHADSCRSDKSANSEVTKGQIKKIQNSQLTSNKAANMKVTNGQIVIDTDYSEFPNGNEYRKTDYNHYKHTASLPSRNDVVVVKGFYSQLLFPKVLSAKTIKDKATTMFQQYLPNADIKQLQEILDEIAGQQKPVASPLGLLRTLLLHAANDTLICTKAAIVQQMRQTRKQIAAMIEIPQPSTAHKTVKTEISEKLRQDVLAQFKTKPKSL